MNLLLTVRYSGEFMQNLAVGQISSYEASQYSQYEESAMRVKQPSIRDSSFYGFEIIT